MSLRPLAVTMGDPAGIGPDVLLAAMAGKEQRSLPPLVVIAAPALLRDRARALGLNVDVREIATFADAARLPNGALGVRAIALQAPVKTGQPDPANAPAIIASIEQAVATVIAGDASAVVTNPIAKATLTAAGFKHPGHTEFLAELAERHRPGRRWQPVMMLASDELRVVPLTIHIPLERVAASLTADLILDTIRITAADLTFRFGIAKPRIAVAGLNPHAGESGTLGRQEIDTIVPALARLRAEGHDVTGPLSADTMFHATARQRYDAAVCMYHDQALIPIKTLAFDTGVNVTLGLPFVRTSPDHGTAFDIAGSGRANPESFIAAVWMAHRMTQTSGTATP